MNKSLRKGNERGEEMRGDCIKTLTAVFLVIVVGVGVVGVIVVVVFFLHVLDYRLILLRIKKVLLLTYA